MQTFGFVGSKWCGCAWLKLSSSGVYFSRFLPRNDSYLLPFSRYWRLELEDGLFSHPPLFYAPARGEPVRISGWNLPPQKLEGYGSVRWKFHNANFNRFCMIHPCDGQTDGQTYGQAIAYSALSIYGMLSRVKNSLQFSDVVSLSCKTDCTEPWPIFGFRSFNCTVFPSLLLQLIFSQTST